jgi:hypothetical protein
MTIDSYPLKCNNIVRVTRRLKNGPIFLKVAKKVAKQKSQNILIKSQFESPKHQTNFETSKYLQQTMF